MAAWDGCHLIMTLVEVLEPTGELDIWRRSASFDCASQAGPRRLIVECSGSTWPAASLPEN